MKRAFLVSLAVILSVFSLYAAAAPAKSSSTDFPYRYRYPDVSILETAELRKRVQEFAVVDVRSSYEFETLRIKDAINIPLGKRDFTDKVRELREKTNKPIVFYCNGRTCQKSYDAAIVAQQARIPDVYAYDAGIFEWAKTAPEHTVLIDKTPIKVSDLIEEDRFKQHLLDPKSFNAKADAGAVILDVRDRVQRDNPLFPFNEERAQLDEKAKIDRAIERAKKERKPLLVYDAVGKQVQWFQYYLEAKGVPEYYFLKGGAQAHFDAKYGKVDLGNKKK